MRTAGRASRGLTLVELGSALAVLAVLATLALPPLASAYERQRLRHAALALAGDITEARFLAAQRNRRVHVQALAGSGSPAGAAAWCWTVALEAGCGCGDATLPSCAVQRLVPADHPALRSITPLALVLEPEAAAQAPAALLLTANGGEQLRIEISPQGRARVCAPAGRSAAIPACS